MTITFQNVGFEWPNGKTIFQNLNFSLNDKIYGLVGPNGAGKTTLARLLAGQLESSSGQILFHHCEIYYFPQEEVPPPFSIAEYLMDTSIYENPAFLSFLGNLPFEQNCHLLSGGEWTRVRLVKAMASGCQFIILDEPTNHLDRFGKEAILEMMKLYDGGLLIISHDREILEKVDEIIEISTTGISFFSGKWSEYDEWRTQEREKLKKDLESAKKNRELHKIKRQEQLEAQEKRQRSGQSMAEKGGAPKILLGRRKRAAEQTLGKTDKNTGDKLNKTVELANQAYQALKVEEVMFAQLPKASVPKGKLVASACDFNFRYPDSKTKLWKHNLSFSFVGPYRVAFTGRNGSGKSTLLKILQGKHAGMTEGELSLGQITTAFLDQEYSVLSQEESIINNVRQSSMLSDVELRNYLAMFLFRGDSIHQVVSSLSGGEKMRVSLAKILLQDPISNLLIMDEPTNNLDMVNIEFLESFLNDYKGALILVSHDKAFLDEISLDEVIHLE